MRFARFKLSPTQRVWFYLTVTLLWITGLAWVALEKWVRVRSDFGEAHHPLQSWSLKVHGAAAMFCLIAIGSLIGPHIRRAWHARKNRTTGGMLVAVMALLIASGYALYYVGSEDARPLISAFHWILGAAVPLIIAGHIYKGRRSYPSASARSKS